MQAWMVNGDRAGTVFPDDRGFSYGDGLFETIALRRGQPRYMQLHMARLASGCQRLAIPLPDPRAIESQIKALTAGHNAGTVKIIVTRGIGPRGYAPPVRPSPTLAVGFSVDPMAGMTGTFAAGWVVASCVVPMSGNRALAGLKTLNRLDNVMGRAECLAKGAAEGIMRGPERQVIGGTMSNLFLVRRGCLETPALDDAGIRGIMRGLVLDLAGKIGIPARECRVDSADLLNAEELFLTNCLIGIRPIRQFDGQSFGLGPVTRQLAAGLLAAGVEECTL